MRTGTAEGHPLPSTKKRFVGCSNYYGGCTASSPLQKARSGPQDPVRRVRLAGDNLQDSRNQTWNAAMLQDTRSRRWPSRPAAFRFFSSGRILRVKRSGQARKTPSPTRASSQVKQEAKVTGLPRGSKGCCRTWSGEVAPARRTGLVEGNPVVQECTRTAPSGRRSHYQPASRQCQPPCHLGKPQHSISTARCPGSSLPACFNGISSRQPCLDSRKPGHHKVNLPVRREHASPCGSGRTPFVHPVPGCLHS